MGLRGSTCEYGYVLHASLELRLEKGGCGYVASVYRP